MRKLRPIGLGDWRLLLTDRFRFYAPNGYECLNEHWLLPIRHARSLIEGSFVCKNIATILSLNVAVLTDNMDFNTFSFFYVC